MQAIAARAAAFLDEAEERVEQEGAVGIVFGDDAVALRVQRVRKRQRARGAGIGEDHHEVEINELLHPRQQGGDEAGAALGGGDFGDGAAPLLEQAQLGGGGGGHLCPYPLGIWPHPAGEIYPRATCKRET